MGIGNHCRHRHPHRQYTAALDSRKKCFLGSCLRKKPWLRARRFLCPLAVLFPSLAMSRKWSWESLGRSNKNLTSTEPLMPTELGAKTSHKNSCRPYHIPVWEEWLGRWGKKLPAFPGLRSGGARTQSNLRLTSSCKLFWGCCCEAQVRNGRVKSARHM